MATIGPSSSDPSTLVRLIAAGVDVVRLNLSHGDIGEHLSRLGAVRAAAAEVGRAVAVLADLPGPKIRAGRFPEGGVELPAGSYVRIVTGDQMSDAGTIAIDHPGITDDLVPGDRIVLGDGAISLTVDSRSAEGVVARVDTGGRTQGSPGVHLSSERLGLTTPTAEDLDFAEVMAAAGVEYLAVSFLRSAVELDPVRAVVAGRARLVAKVETAAAVADLVAIVESSDAVMVARGGLGIDCPFEDVPHLQKTIIRECVERGVPVITATQMLESMVAAPSPTRAEVSDVANAVFDGTDALMLSGETAVGHDPVGVVTTMAAIAERAEREASYRAWADRLGRVQRARWDSVGGRITAALGHAATLASRDVEASAILCCTRSGRTARAMARFRPDATLLGLSPDPAVVRSMALSWGVVPVEVDTYDSTDEMVWYAVETAVRSGRVTHGDTVLVLAGAPHRPSGAAADVLRIVRVD